VQPERRHAVRLPGAHRRGGLDRSGGGSRRPGAEARAELQACAGTQFDACVVAAFLEVLDEEDVAAPAPPLPLALR
jgi:hypothetical protein